ncbi:MAG: hypothetical protein JXX28_13235, partial [Deltaproteobacteria bacterium]|nr:hypothetical protein [Deltaproteobacteria bacterium]
GALTCDPAQGSVRDDSDCDDAHAAAHPGGTEVCDGLDNDCDAAVDEDAADAPTWYADGDTDGYGDLSTSARSCAQPEGYVADSRDCDDAQGGAHPGAAERCDDSYDNDCDGQINEPEATDAETWHLDADSDGFGRPGAGLRACVAPEGYVGSTTDCDDLDDTVFPGAAQRCDGLANDCDSGLPADEADGDGDGYMACEGDCDDGDDGVHPGAAEHCDGVDEDCNTLVDDRPVDPTLWHLDEDGDGYGHLYVTRSQCEQPAEFVSDGTDCDDTDPTTNPGELEIPGNGKDDTCDGEDLRLTLYVTARYAGKLWALDLLTEELLWTAEGLGELTDVVRGPDGTLYAARIDGPIVAVDADGGSSRLIPTSALQPVGMWYDTATDTLLVTDDVGGAILEIDPATGVETPLLTGLAQLPYHTVRFAGDDRLYTTFGDAQELRVYDPTSGAWSVLAELEVRPYLMVPAQDGGFWVSDGVGQQLAHVGRFGDTSQVPVGERIYGICASAYGDGSLLAGDHVDGVLAIDPASGDHLEVLSGLESPWGCVSNALADQDGDGFSDIAYGGSDCDDLDDTVNPDAVDLWGDGADDNCDFVDGTDADGDGIPADHATPDCADQDDADPAVGTLPTCVQRTCAEILSTRGAGTPSGLYTIDPDGDMDLSDAFEVYCDMETDGGGWTRIGPSFPMVQGRDCVAGYPSFDASDRLALSSNAGTWGSGQHGGCGVSLSEPIDFRYVRTTALAMTGIAICGSVPFPNFVVQVVDDTDGPRTPYTQYHYPGWSYESIDDSFTTLSYMTQYNGNLSEGGIYDAGSQGEHYLHAGVGSYSGCFNRPVYSELWVK